MEFSQSEFFGGFPALSYMDTVGYVYVPTACQNGEGKILCLLKLLLATFIYCIFSMSTSHCISWLSDEQVINRH